MGYTTTFEGSFKLDRALRPEHRDYLLRFSETRRMSRKQEVNRRPDPRRLAVGLEVGVEGEFYVGDEDWAGQGHTSDIIDYNCAPRTQPGLWCKWAPNQDGTAIEWTGAEKFYGYEEWLRYLVENFLKKWGYKLNGEVTWEGEDNGDFGTLVVQNGLVLAHARIRLQNSRLGLSDVRDRANFQRMKYRLRAEVPLDVALLLVALSRADVNVADCEQRQLPGYPDVDFIFNCNASIEKIREVMRTIEDSHVMLETVALFGEYTGERDASIR